ncbi:hypothetical protein C1H46_035692 [Malus baccata]|uniref:Uncharacterized protein n=1 Tax=Malus baccata TaxID=106549 RepID=A0A540KX29_MALBA|nr:hypothetical protein C1H46_035692 [Malus baccata]
MKDKILNKNIPSPCHQSSLIAWQKGVLPSVASQKGFIGVSAVRGAPCLSLLLVKESHHGANGQSLDIAYAVCAISTMVVSLWTKKNMYT